MDNNLTTKKKRLDEIIKEMDSVAVAFSAGVDSTFLLAVAHDVLGDKAVAVTARSCFFPQAETTQAEVFCKEHGIRHIMIDADPLSDTVIASNPTDRCYHCKKRLFREIVAISREQDLAFVAEGSNADDMNDYRPGMRAVAELGIRSPLREAGLSKTEIRVISKELGLDTWNKPSYACLATRFVYGDTLTQEKLLTVEKAEDKLHSMGFEQVRVRCHGNVARIELEAADMPRAVRTETAGEIVSFLSGLGFAYTALDLAGYKTGSMNLHCIHSK